MGSATTRKAFELYSQDRGEDLRSDPSPCSTFVGNSPGWVTDCADGAQIWDAYHSQHGGHAHLCHTHTHFLFVRFPTRNCQLFSGSNPNPEKDRVLVLCQVLLVSDHYLLL